MNSVFNDMHSVVFDTFGCDATVVRGTNAPVSVRIVVNYGSPRYGEFGQIVGSSTTVDFLRSQWRPEQGDVLTWTDHLGAQTRPVSALDTDDGYIVKAVLRG